MNNEFTNDMPHQVDEPIIAAQPDEKEPFLALLPLKNVVILPKSIVPIIVGRQSSILAVEHALKHGKTIFITSQKDQSVEQPTISDVFTYGARSTILQVMRMPNGALKILAEGICRAKITQPIQSDEFMAVECQDLPTTGLDNQIELEACWRQMIALYNSYVQLNKDAPTDLMMLAKTVQDMDYVTDTVAVHMNLSFEERQKILETANLKDRILLMCTFLQKEIDILQTEIRIKGHVQTQVEKNQREYYLTEQMKAIHKELGRDDISAEIKKLQDKAKKLGMTKDAREKVEKEIKRLEQMPPLSSEAVISRHYIDWALSLPWTHASKDTISLVQAEKILASNHAGLKKAKERIIEFLAAKKFSKSIERSPIICLAGPPGVGKTSLAKSIADSLSREFVRISLGGIRDEAEIRGHRRTYIGALPGKIIQAMKRAGTVNPVILLDEIDKMANDMHGDPASALLEVLDPEQNKTFADHFLDTEYDLSKVMFITTANVIDNIPYPLYDRMEIINLSGYTDEEKLSIAQDFLIPKNVTEYGFEKQQFKLPEDVLKTVISQYTKEAGVRQLERVIAKLMRKAIQLLLKQKDTKRVEVTPELLHEWLGNPPFKKTSLNTAQEKIGLVTGLAWTEVGGDVLEIETSVVPGKGSLTLTGQLGDVMQESAQAALSYIRSRAADLNIAKNFNSTKDLHIHMPEGSTPKDGPSAGISMCTALVSALTNNPVKHHLAMTGEITLRGRVLSIGGLKEKLLAAKQHGITTVIVPQENKNDVDEIRKEIDLNDVDIIFVHNMDEVLKAAFINDPFAKSATAKKAPKKKKPTKPKK